MTTGITSNELQPNDALKLALETEIETYNYPYGRQVDQAKLLNQQIIIREAIKQGADIDVVLNKSPSVAIETLKHNKDVLLNQFSVNSFLKLVLKESAYTYNSTTYKNEVDSEKLKVQRELIIEALDNGADINSIIDKIDQYNYHCFRLEFSIDFLAKHKEFLFNLSKPITAENFLKLILRTNVNFEANTNLQGELIKEALNNGADINNFVGHDQYNFDFFSLDYLAKHKEFLFNIHKPITIENFLELILRINPNSEASANLQGELIKEALDNGADINNIHLNTLETLSTHKDILLNHPTNSLSVLNFLKFVLETNAYAYNSTTYKREADYKKIKIQGQLIKEALDLGADINSEVANGSKYDRHNAIYVRGEILNDHKSLLLDNQVNPLTIDNFLVLLMKVYYLETKYQLVEEAIAHGANVNTMVYTKLGIISPLEYAYANNDQNLVKLLKAHGATCGVDSNRTASIIEHEKLDNSFIYKHAALTTKNLETPKAENNKIPYLIHHIWLTHPQSPREIYTHDIENVIQTKKLFEESDKKWTHIVWTNDKSLIPNSTQELEKHGIEIRSIQSDEFKDNIRLFDQIIELIDQKLWGQASDTLRYSLVKHFGGVYADLNFEFKRNIEDDLYKFDYFAAKPQHPIMSSLLDIIELNLIQPPSYVTSIDRTDEFMETVYISFLPFSLAYLRSSNLDSNIDIVYPNGSPTQGKWIEEECVSPWLVMQFPEQLGISGNQDLLIGHDGSNGLTWLEN